MTAQSEEIAKLREELAGAREVLTEYDKLVDDLRAEIATLKAGAHADAVK